MTDDDTTTAAARAREAVVTELLTQLVYLGVMVAASWCVMNRDRLWQAREWWRNRNARPDPHAREVAEFRRTINDISRGTAGPPAQVNGGLYG